MATLVDDDLPLTLFGRPTAPSTIAAPVEHELVIKKSRFITLLHPWPRSRTPRP
ncbi:hypothetical protein NKG05_28360 [Oerskovia sp. M15]